VIGSRAYLAVMLNPLRLAPVALGALFSVADAATRLPSLAGELERRASRVVDELAAVRRGVDPLDERLTEGLGSIEERINEMAELQRTTNAGIAALVRGVDPLEGGIARTSDNTAQVGDHMVELRELISAMLDELGSLRSTLEPVGNTAQRIERFRRRLPGGQ
jgi:hypothetical protein